VEDVGNDDLFEGGGKFVPPKLGRLAEAAGNLRIGPDGKLWRYDGGVYRSDAEKWLAAFVRAALGDEFRRNRLAEVRAWCMANTADRLPTQPATGIINVANGILHWRETPPRLEPHNPESTSILQIPVAWDPEAECPTVIQFLRRVLPDSDLEEHVMFVFEWIGYLLIPSAKMQRALLLQGPGDSGKSTFIALVNGLLGPTLVSNHSLQAICDERFTSADLYGKLANICADLDARAIQRAGRFKELVAGDTITAEFKFKDHFSYKPFARLMFSANEAPGSSDQSGAYFKRWLVLPMTRIVSAEEQNPDLGEQVAAELPGVLRYSVAGLKRLWRRGRFDPPPAMTAAWAAYRANSDTVVAFAEERLRIGQGTREKVGTVYGEYSTWCAENGRQKLGLQRFKEHLLATYPAVELKPRLHGYPTLDGVGLSGKRVT
jgi:putative DNA primase/helicase